MIRGLNPYAAKSSAKTRSEAQKPAVEPVPAGTSAEILAWVGSDPDRAQRALDTEESGNARKSLISKLKVLLK